MMNFKIIAAHEFRYFRLSLLYIIIVENVLYKNVIRI